MKFRLLPPAMWVLFAAGLTGCVGSRHLVHGTQHQHLVTIGGIALSLAAGTYVMRREPLKSWLKTKPVMWFLFLFNLAVAVAAPFLIHGSQGIMTAAGMGTVSLGAGIGLLKNRGNARARAGADAQRRQMLCRHRPTGIRSTRPDIRAVTPCSRTFLTHARHEEHLVVHGEAEQDADQVDRQEAEDRPGTGRGEQAG
jgi:hypothetical protein